MKPLSSLLKNDHGQADAATHSQTNLPLPAPEKFQIQPYQEACIYLLADPDCVGPATK